MPPFERLRTNGDVHNYLRFFITQFLKNVPVTVTTIITIHLVKYKWNAIKYSCDGPFFLTGITIMMTYGLHCPSRLGAPGDFTMHLA